MNRVQLRNNTWYFRARIPAPLQYLAPVKYFFRSLHTGNRKEALAKSLSHSYILDLEIKLLRKLDMLIKSGKIVLDKDDINKIIKYKLDQLTDALSDNYDDIVDGTFDKDSISVFKGNTSDDEHVANSMESVFREYITDLKDKPETHHSVIKQINRIIDTNMTLIQEVKSVKTSQKTLFNALKGVDKYTADMIECEHDDKTMDKWIHPMVNACLKSLSGKNTECLWDFYINSIKSGYVQKNGKIVNLYDYMGELADDALYYPTDFSLLTDFFIKNMPADDYDTWISSFSQISLDNNKCNKCHYHKYGLAGLYTIMESAFYINQNEIWLAFIHIDNDDKKQNYIVVYALPDKTEKDIPPEFDEWLNRLKKHYPEGIKLKYFTNSELVDLPYFL